MTTTHVIVAETPHGVLVVRSGPRVAPSKRAVARSKRPSVRYEHAAHALEATVQVAVASARLSRALTRGIAIALRTAAAPELAIQTSVRPTPRVVRLRTHRRLAALGAPAIAGSIVVVRVTDRGARGLRGLIAAVRAAGALGIQIVWDGEDPAPARVAQHVFVALEDARGTPSGPPVVLARSAEVSLALRLMTKTTSITTSAASVPTATATAMTTATATATTTEQPKEAS